MIVKAVIFKILYIFLFFSAFLLGLIFFPKFFTASLTSDLSPIASPIVENPVIEESALEEPVLEEPAAEIIIENSFVLQEELDNIAEKLDIIKQQVAELVAEKAIAKKQEVEEKEENNKKEEIVLAENQAELPKITVKKIEGESAPKPVYPKILISEAQILPIENRFIELYNPNESDVNLTGWYLQRKTATSDSFNSLVSSTKFEGKIIPANGYFLIAKQDVSADIYIDDLTLSESNFLILKDPNRDVSDEASWPELADNLSWCREFSVCSPTQKAQNIAYVESAVKPPEETKDITPPTGTIIINNGAVYTSSRNVVLTISAADDSSGAIEMKIANASSYHDWEPFSTVKNWVLPATEGLKTVRIKFRDYAGNETPVGIPATITLDTGAIVDSGDYFPN